MSSPTTTSPSAFSLSLSPPPLSTILHCPPPLPIRPCSFLAKPNQANPGQSGPTKNFPSPTLSPPLREPRSKEGGAAGLLISGGSPSDPEVSSNPVRSRLRARPGSVVGRISPPLWSRPLLLREEPRGFVAPASVARSRGRRSFVGSLEKQIGRSASGDGFLRLRRAVGFSSGAKAGF